VPLVIDAGPGLVLVGVAGEGAPRVEFPAVVGRAHHHGSLGLPDGRTEYVGEEALGRRGLLQLSFPMEYGFVTNWTDMEAVWRYALDAVAPPDTPPDHDGTRSQRPHSQRPVLVTEPPLNPRLSRERMAAIMFERFGVPAFYVANYAVLALYAAGLTSGLVLSSNEGVTFAVPVHEGYALPHAIVRSDLSGRSVTEYLTRLLNEAGHSLTTAEDVEAVQGIRDQLAYVATDFAAELVSANATSAAVKLPDGRTINVGAERFRAPELLFDPSLVGSREHGIHDMCAAALARCDADLRAEMYANIVLAGSNTLFDGLDARLEKELRALTTEDVHVHIVAPPQRKYTAWLGGSILASLSAFEGLWIHREEYDTGGPSIVHSKAPGR